MEPEPVLLDTIPSVEFSTCVNVQIIEKLQMTFCCRIFIKNYSFVVGGRQLFEFTELTKTILTTLNTLIKNSLFAPKCTIPVIAH